MGFSLERVQRVARCVAIFLALTIPLGLWIGGAQPFAVGLFESPWDKLVHMVVFAVLAWAIGLASGRPGVSALVIGFTGAVLVGVFDELRQMSLPGRSADVDDLVADAVGAALGVAVLAVRIEVRAWLAAHEDGQ